MSQPPIRRSHAPRPKQRLRYLLCFNPSVVTPAAGSVVRDGREGYLVAPAEIASLAKRMEQLGTDPELRAAMSARARARALEFTWARYQRALMTEVTELLDPC